MIVTIVYLSFLLITSFKYQKEYRHENNKKAEDWHRADIRAELEKRGMSLRKLSREAGLSENTLRNALDRKWPKGEKIIAGAIGVKPEEIWPSRYPNK